MRNRAVYLGILTLAVALAAGCARERGNESRPNQQSAADDTVEPLAPTKVLIVTDGSVKLFAHHSKLQKLGGQGNQHKWVGAGAGGASVAVSDCAVEDDPQPKAFSTVAIEILDNGKSAATLTLDAQGTLTAQPSGYEIRGSGRLYHVHGPNGPQELAVGKVTITEPGGTVTPLDPSGETCITFE